MYTLLQNLLIETLDEEESILREFINNILPALEREFALVPALGGVEKNFANKADQSLLVHVLNGLLVAWNLSNNLAEPLSDIEQRLLCLGFTLHDYDKALHNRGEESPKAHEVSEIVRVCQKLAIKLDFPEFWQDWENYILDICYLAQNTQKKKGSNRIASNWENDELELQLDNLELDRLCELMTFGDIAVHMNNPADIVTKRGGKRLEDCLGKLGLDHNKLVYHRLRDSRGLLTNQIHHAIVNFTQKCDWQPILYFAQGTVYLAPENVDILSIEEIQEFVWENIIQGDAESNIRGLEEQFRNGDVGFIRSGKGLKIAPLTRELFSPAQLIGLLPDVFIGTVKNIKNPATPKRLEKLTLNDEKRKFLEQGADVWSDRLAELIIFVQKEFFAGNEEYINWILNRLNLQNEISLEETKIQKGGVNYGWYQAAASYIAKTELDRHPNSEELSKFFQEFGEGIAEWATENSLLPQHQNPTYQAVCDYLADYLEISGWERESIKFTDELAAYTAAKFKNKAICSLSSGEFAAEDQLESVVLFKQQQYSNKNALGGRRIKRGISKIWSLEMMMRQAYWAVPAGKLEDQRPIFLYIFPAYVYSPQTVRAIGRLVKKIKKINLWEVCKQWRKAEMKFSQLQYLLEEEKEPKSGRYQNKYDLRELPFMAMTYTKTRGNTDTDAWVEPAFISLILPILFGVKVVATPSPDPIYFSDEEFLESVRLDGVAGFWNILGLKNDLRLQELEAAFQLLLIAYSLHLETRSSPPDAKWQALNGTVREVKTNVLNVFALANKKLRADKRDASNQEVLRYWKYAEQLSVNSERGRYLMELMKKLVEEYRIFYQASLSESSHTILLPISKALEIILSVPQQLDNEDVIMQGSGQLRDAIERQEIYKRPIIANKSVDYSTRQEQEITAIHAFMTTCVKELFLGLYQGDRALLQENRNRIKSGAEFAYRWLALQEKSKPETNN
ncbi:CRISPR-associated protein Csc3 [Calothrix parasitica NIES-267]|uniref:CRISPR-associated protein Csc3 n=1 Tax=Calothrix parasitica NIES-267 TaxID=1973488 RepID=A0A1Z4LRS2_9CYAN|nr:CRISPR-associated protein Csc3 [Calothrix parasitica NIES-267]